MSVPDRYGSDIEKVLGALGDSTDPHSGSLCLEMDLGYVVGVAVQDRDRDAKTGLVAGGPGTSFGEDVRR